jgi:hypothetical protein
MAHTLRNFAPVGSLLKGDRKPRKQARRVMDDSHRRFIASLPCIVSRVEGQSQAAHLRFASSAYGKPITGGSQKADDCWTLPLSAALHDEQHRAGNEIAWWASKGIADPLVLCLRLYAVSGDEVAARKIIGSVRIEG